MPNAKPRRRPPLYRSLPAFLPSFAAVALAAVVPKYYALLPLLIAASLCMAAACYAIGFGGAAGFLRTTLRRGTAHLIGLALYTALVLVLVAWPLAALLQAPSLFATLGLCAALVAALALLWRTWPVFGLVFEWEDAFPAGTEHSWITSALARSARFAGHLTHGRDVFLTHFLPASIAQLAVVCAALALAGLGADIPDEVRTAALFVFAVALLPLASLIVANRTIKLLFLARGPQLADPTPADDGGVAKTPATPEASDAPATPDVEGELAATEAAGATAPRTPQAELDASLLAAVHAGDTAAARGWLDAGADPNAAPPPGARDQRSVLMLAAELTDTHLLRALIAKGADVNRVHAGLTALLAATRSCGSGRAETVTTLITNGADPAAADGDGNTALHHAALCAEPAVAAVLVDAEAPLEARNHNQATPLSMAADAGNWPLVKFLAEHHANPDPALPAAAGTTEDDPEGVRLLLKHRGHVNATDALQRTALLNAAREGHVEIAHALLDAGADPALPDRYGTTALMEAARAGATDVVALLGEHHADAEAADQHGRTALLLACQSPRADADCVRALLALGADPRRTGGDGRNAIDQATAAGRWNIVAALDPEAALPASHATAASVEIGADTPAHLLDALRFDNWSTVARFTTQVADWPEAELAALYLQLADQASATARGWLLEHGLSAEARLAGGGRLFDALVEHLPASRAALRQLLALGATPAGAGLLARALARLGDSTDDARFALALLEGGADAFGADAAGRTPLHHAARPALAPVLDALLARGVDPNLRDAGGATPLHAAMAAPDAAALPLVRALIAHGANPEVVAANGETPLGLALARGATQLERWLRWNLWPLPGRPLRADDLPTAAADPDAVARLLDLGFDPNIRDARGATALLHAAGAGALASVQRLLAAHADPLLAAESGATPLSAAVSARHDDCVQALIEGGVAVDHPHAGGVTALMIAAALGLPETAATLRRLGADVTRGDEDSRTALHAAARFAFGSRDSLRCRRLIDALLPDNAARDRADARGATPLLVLLGAQARPGAECDGTHLGALLPALLDAGADIHHADEHGVTVLHACAMHALIEPARVLLARGADREARDCVQRTPADLARLLGYIDLALELAPRRNAASTNASVVTPVLTHPDQA